ncbi:MAG: radical SAM protein [Longimicrobiales bacterium]
MITRTPNAILCWTRRCLVSSRTRRGFAVTSVLALLVGSGLFGRAVRFVRTSGRRTLRFCRDLRNVGQAQIAIRNKRWYLPSLFAHYTVNSVCNLRCSYCYVGQPEIFPEGFTNQGLPIDRAKRVLATLREECLFLRILGGEPLLYGDVNELVRYAKKDLRYWHVSIITNGLLLARQPERYEPLLENLDLLTISLDRTRATQYPKQIQHLEAFLPELAALCRRHSVDLTGNYTATWAELDEPAEMQALIDRWRPHFAGTYVTPVRLAGKTPLPLLKAAVDLNRRYSLGRYTRPEYPAVENVEWYREYCDPKLKIKVDAAGGLVYPCENHSYTAGSLEEHSIRALWSKELVRYPNESCIGCGKQRFRSEAFKSPVAIAGLARNLARSRRVAT